MPIAKLSLILAAAAALMSTGAAAEDSGLRTVGFADLDLTTTAGVATLERRVKRAVKSICSPEPGLSGGALAAEQAQCEAETTAGVRKQIDATIAAHRAQRLRTAGL